MEHATAQDLQPTAALANRAAFSSANYAFHIHLCAGLSEGKIGRAEAGMHRITKHTSGKISQVPFRSPKVMCLPTANNST
jgi:hypothetical protein